MTRSVTGLVLAAGSSTRLGRPKQLLPFAGATLLDATLGVARRTPFTQRLVTLGGAAEKVRDAVDLTGFDVIDALHFTDGCSSSIVSALAAVAPESEGLVLMLGDQPGVSPAAVALLVDAGIKAPLAVCRYDDGIGHPFWFRREVFEDLQTLHGDKGVWKLMESGRHEVLEVPVTGSIPLDVDTWDDYQELLRASGEAS